MAVVVVYKSESIDSALKRFVRQVIKEGILAEVVERRFNRSKNDARRFAAISRRRSRARARRRAKGKPRVTLYLKEKVI